jgi:hypothetical protein
MSSVKTVQRFAIDQNEIFMVEHPNNLAFAESVTVLGVEALTEAIARSVGMLILFLGLFVWLIPQGMFAGSAHASQIFLSLTSLGIGLGTYMVGTRGFLRGIELDRARRRLIVQRINLSGTHRVARKFALDDVESLYLRRHGRDAELCLRTTSGRDVASLRGPIHIMEEVHERLCRELKASARPVRPRRPVTQLAT